MSREELDGREQTDSVLIEGEDDAELDILNELNAAEQDTTWFFRVSRVLGTSSSGAKEPFLFEGDATLMEGLHNKLRDEFGTGTYRVRVLKNRRLYRRFDVSVEASAKPTPAVMAQSEMATVLGAIEKSNERMMQVMERLADRAALPAVIPASPTFDPMSMFDKILGMFQKLQPQHQPDDVATKSIDLILKGVELGKSVQGSDNPKGMMDIISDLINSPLLGKLVEAQNLQPPMQLPPRLPSRQVKQSQPLGDGKDRIVPPAPAEATPQNQQIQVLRQRILYLLEKANHGSSFETYSEWVFDNWEPQLISDFLSQPDPLLVLRNLAPEIAPQSQWFTDLIDDLRKLVNAAGEPGDTASDALRSQPSPIVSNGNSGRESGSAGDFEDDERIGEGG